MAASLNKFTVAIVWLCVALQVEKQVCHYGVIFIISGNCYIN